MVDSRFRWVTEIRSQRRESESVTYCLTQYRRCTDVLVVVFLEGGKGQVSEGKEIPFYDMVIRSVLIDKHKLTSCYT